MFLVILLINLLFISAQIHFSSTYNWKHSIVNALSFTIYAVIVFPHATFQFIYIYLDFFFWLLSIGAFLQRDKLFKEKDTQN